MFKALLPFYFFKYKYLPYSILINDVTYCNKVQIYLANIQCYPKVLLHSLANFCLKLLHVYYILSCYVLRLYFPRFNYLYCQTVISGPVFKDHYKLCGVNILQKYYIQYVNFVLRNYLSRWSEFKTLVGPCLTLKPLKKLIFYQH